MRVGFVRSFTRVIFMVLGLAACQSLPDRAQVGSSYKQKDVSDTDLAGQMAPLVKQHAGKSGAYPLSSGLDALVARLALVNSAQKTLDLQYYIWHSDKAGRMLAWSLLEAADRGVRVRLLLDDMGSPLGDESLLLMDGHPNIEIRLFNPLSDREWRIWSMMTEFGRVNRRMHNKSLTADNTVSIVGGRNIGNEYFEANSDVVFADLDLAVIGPVVEQVSDGFDLYWNHETSYPVSLLSSHQFTEAEMIQARQDGALYIEAAKQSEYAGRLLSADLVKTLGVQEWFWGEASVLYDHPSKALADEPADDLLLSTQLSQVFGDLSQELLLVSPYFVPGKDGVQFLQGLVDKGIQVTIVTNSLAATDVGAVHSGYAKYRKDLLKAGVVIYEMRPDPNKKSESAEHDKSAFIGSSAQASLHAKAFFLDRRTTFVGSMNLDPRSLLINTEIGVILHSSEFTDSAHKQILLSAKDKAYKLSLDQEGDIIWTAWQGGAAIQYDSEPMVSAWRRFAVWCIGLFPIESQL